LKGAHLRPTPPAPAALTPRVEPAPGAGGGQGSGRTPRWRPQRSRRTAAPRACARAGRARGATSPSAARSCLPTRAPSSHRPAARGAGRGARGAGRGARSVGRGTRGRTGARCMGWGASACARAPSRACSSASARISSRAAGAQRQVARSPRHLGTRGPYTPLRILLFEDTLSLLLHLLVLRPCPRALLPLLPLLPQNSARRRHSLATREARRGCARRRGPKNGCTAGRRDRSPALGAG